jgi:hypothetical protein
MPKVIKGPECGNSPKNLLVQALAIAIETSNRSAFVRCTTDDVTWAIPGRRTFAGRPAAQAYLRSRAPAVVKKVVMRRIVSHGRAGAADGTLILQTGETLGFCHVVEFSNAKGQRMSSIYSYYSNIGETD